jgi:hypothetical protein
MSTARRLWFAKAFVVLTVLATSLCAQDTTLPTASENPAVIDQAWQNATAKFSPQRGKLLEEVDRADHEGP